MAAAGEHPHIVGLLAACLEPPLAVVQVGWGCVVGGCGDAYCDSAGL